MSGTEDIMSLLSPFVYSLLTYPFETLVALLTWILQSWIQHAKSRKNPEGYKKIKVRLSQAAPFLKLIYHNLYKNNSLSITQYLPTICTGILRHPLGWEPYHTTHGTPERYTSYVLVARHTLRDMPEQYLWSIEMIPDPPNGIRKSQLTVFYSRYIAIAWIIVIRYFFLYLYLSYNHLIRCAKLTKNYKCGKFTPKNYHETFYNARKYTKNIL